MTQERSYFKGGKSRIRVYPYALSRLERYGLYKYEQLLFMRWYERLWYWFKVTIKLILRGKGNRELEELKKLWNEATEGGKK